MTIRAELERLGAEAVRAGMAAFDHRGASGWCGAPPCPDNSWGAHSACCFLTHAAAPGAIAEEHTDDPAVQMFYRHHHSSIERVFEGGADAREELRRECIAFLAEHGSAVENRPAHSLKTSVLGGPREPAHV